MGLAKSAPNSICSHIKILGIRTIWQNQLAYHITELTIRMNKQDELGVTTRLRIREAQLKSMCLNNIISNNKKLDDIKLKFNLAFRIISEARKFGFSFQESNAYEVKLDIGGTSLLTMLGKKEIINYRNSNNMNIFTLEQLITNEGNTLLTWQQVKYIRGLKSRGRKPNWYKSIEEKVLENSSSRKVKEKYQVEASNRVAIRCKDIKVSADKRKKEWIIFEKGIKVESGKVIKKESRSLIVEHWQIIVNNDNKNTTYLEKCKGCNLGRRNDQSCMIRQKCDSWHQVLERVYRDRESLYIKTSISAYKRDRELSDMEVVKNVRNIEISIVDIEEAVIQRVVKDKKLQVELSRLARSIKGKKELDIYTDRSLVIEALEDKEMKKIGIGWVIADNSSSNCSISFSCRILD